MQNLQVHNPVSSNFLAVFTTELVTQLLSLTVPEDHGVRKLVKDYTSFQCGSDLSSSCLPQRV